MSIPGAVAGILLAAGAGRRYGRPKALVTDGAGRHWLATAVDALRAGGCRPVVVVLGAAAAEARAGTDLAGTLVVDHAGWAEGMGSSLRAALTALTGSGARPDVVAALVMLVDTPGIGPAAVARLAGYAATDVLARATYRGRPGHPVLLGRDHWTGVAALATGEEGARGYLERHRADLRPVPCDDLADGTDHDEPRRPTGPRTGGFTGSGSVPGESRSPRA